MAVTTLTSEDRGNWSRPGPMAIVPASTWFGHKVPDGVMHITIMRDFLNDELLVRWRVKGDAEIHQMPFEQTDDGVMASLAAMKLTC